MAHNTYVKGTYAAWATGTAVTQADFWKLDQNQYKSINGDEGGTWAPSSTITIGGSGLTVAGAFLSTSTGVFSGGFAATGNAAFGATAADYFYVYSSSTFFGPATISAGTSLTTAGALIATGSATFSGAFTINNGATIGSDSVDALTVNSTTTFESPVTTTDTLTCSAGLGASAISCSGTISALGGLSCGGDLSSHGDSNLGDGASVSNVTINATQSYTGPETHNGAVGFAGASTFDGSATFNGTTSLSAASTVIGTSLLNNLTVRSTTQFENNVTVGTDSADSLSVNATANFLNNVTIGSDSGDTLTTNATASFNNSVVLGSDSGDTLNVRANSTIAGPTYFSTTSISNNYEKISMSGSGTKYEYDPNTIIVTHLNGVDRVLTLGIAVSPVPQGLTKHISYCPDSPANTLAVICGVSGRVLGSLSSGEGVRVISDGTSWYTAG